jgi:hypothetical protein
VYARYLWDGQTGELLASTKTEGYASQPHDQVGNIHADNDLDTLSDCHPGGDCGFSKVNQYIDARMKREGE